MGGEKPFKVSGAQLQNRITPAWAGKSPPLWYASTAAKDHPRMGGEKLRFPAFSARELGSPPHGRGKGGVLDDFAGLGGITPAWAGKSTFRTTPTGRYKDHPRMGGEKSILGLSKGGEKGSPPHGRGKAQVLPAGISSEGSPPHGRGKDAVQRHATGCVGIIPALAGKR